MKDIHIFWFGGLIATASIWLVRLGHSLIALILILVGTIILAILHILIKRNYRRRQLTCRLCGKEGAMAITYETDGLCRDCLLEVIKIPGVLKDNNEEPL